jgi:sarcosine oxidase subunit alpha
VQVGDEPSVRACTRPVEPGMVVEAQNAWPSLDRDIMALTALGDRFLSAGFYYKAFIQPPALWPVYEEVLRNAAGLGKVNPDTPPGEYRKQYLHTDVAVVGGGPAGMQAALAAAAQGARVLLLDESPALGGHLRFAVGNAEDAEKMAELTQEVVNQPGISIYTDTTVLGWYEENWLAAKQHQQLFKIRAGSVVYATGAYEQPRLFDNNDLPGVMLGSAVQRLLHLYRVTPGRQAVILTANEDGWQVAADLLAAGVQIAALVDERSTGNSPHQPQILSAGVPVLWHHTIQAAAGSRSLSSVIVIPADEKGRPAARPHQKIPCDLLAVSVGWSPANGLLYQANGRIAYDPQRAEFLPAQLPAGIYAAGRVTGSHQLATQLAQGKMAGRQAAAHAGFGPAPAEEDSTGFQDQIAQEPLRTTPRVQVPGKKKQFLCYCEDVTLRDLEQSIAEGYNSIELLKRYSTISMGPCQGKMCSVNTIHLCAQANGMTITETGTTTARPPMQPVPLGVLAGQNMEPVRHTAIHDWHIDQGAIMMVAGLWLRPEHYGDPTAEVRAVREKVGLIDVSTLGKFRLTGPGVPDFLDRVYVNKWQKLRPGRVRYGIMCNDEGIILNDGVTAHVGGQEWYMTTTSTGAGAMFEWLQWWLQSGWGAGVHLVDVTEVYAAFNLTGPHARQVLAQLTNDDVSHQALAYMGVRDMLLAGVPCRVLRIGFTGELSFEIHCPAGYGSQIWTALMTAGDSFGLRPFGMEAQRILRLEKGHLIVGQDTDALSDPLAANQEWVVKLDKKDFLGHRSLVRINQTGTQQRLVGFKMKNSNIIPEEGLQIVTPASNGSPTGLAIIGWVSSSRYSPSLKKAIGLCWLPAELAEQEGATFTIRREGQLIPATVHHGPFYDPAGERLRH